MLLDDIRAYLTAQNYVTTLYPLYEGYMPDDTAQTVAVFETGGMPPDTMNREYERVTFQFRVRGERLKYAVVRAQWLKGFTLLQDSQLGAPSTYVYVQAMHYGPIVFNDDKGRPNFISNFRVMRLTEIG